MRLRTCPVHRSRSRGTLRCCRRRAIYGSLLRAPPAPLLRRAHIVRANLRMASFLARPARLAMIALYLALATWIARPGLRNTPQVQYSVDFPLLWCRRMCAAVLLLDATVIHLCQREAGSGIRRGAAAYVPSVREGQVEIRAKDLEERGGGDIDMAGWLGCSALDDPQRRLDPSRRSARRIKHDCSVGGSLQGLLGNVSQ